MAKRGPKGPSKPMDDKTFRQLVAMVKIQCTQDEICDVLGMSKQTLDLRVKERGYRNFRDIFRQKRGMGKASLRRMQWKSAEGGNPTMLVWLGKQVLGQTDKHEVSGPDSGPVLISVTEESLIEKARRLGIDPRALGLGGSA